MTDHLIAIPEHLYERAQQIAETTAQTVEVVISSRLEESLGAASLDIPDDEQAELRALGYLSNDALWTIAREQMSQEKQSRLTDLLERNSLHELPEAEQDELAQLVELGDRLTLRKAEAMRLLMQRGHQITLESLDPDNA